MSSSTSYPSQPEDPASDATTPEQQAQQAQTRQQQTLPAPGEGTPVTLDISGGEATAKLTELGPLVVGVDGTVARVSNWKEMTEAERETTLRVLGRRNKQRLEALRKAKDEQEEGGGSQ